MRKQIAIGLAIFAFAGFLFAQATPTPTPTRTPAPGSTIINYPGGTPQGPTVTLINAAATGNGNIIRAGWRISQSEITITAATGVTAGAIRPEVSDDCAYAGTWAPLTPTPIPLTAAGKTTVFVSQTFNCLRAPISTEISGGDAPTVTIKFTGR